jgi:hypothetical protein
MFRFIIITSARLEEWITGVKLRVDAKIARKQAIWRQEASGEASAASNPPAELPVYWRYFVNSDKNTESSVASTAPSSGGIPKSPLWRFPHGMGRDNAPPRRFFGVTSRRTAIPLSMFCRLAALPCWDVSCGAELLNFGAFIEFVEVNLSALLHYRFEGRISRLINLTV